LEISVTSDHDDREGNGGEIAVAGKDLQRSYIDGGHPFDLINQSRRLGESRAVCTFLS
jgi:hypothetical protein